MFSKSLSLYDTLKSYTQKGYKLFPVSSSTKSKVPLFKDNLKKASDDIDQLMKWADEFPGCNWAISLAESGCFCIDVDNRHQGLEKWERVREKLEPFQTLEAKTGSGGAHYVFRLPPDLPKELRFRKQLQKGIDIKYNGFIVVEPSINTDGDAYEWLNWGVEPLIAPKDVLDTCTKMIVNDGLEFTAQMIELGDSQLEKLVEALKPFSFSYDEWVSVGMAIHSSDPTNRGLELYLSFTENSSYEDGDFDQAVYKWDTFCEDDDGVRKIGVGTLVHLIKLKGGKVPKFTPKQASIFYEEYKTTIQAEMLEKQGWFEEDFVKVTYHKEFLIKSLNDMGYRYYRKGGKASFLKVKTEPTGQVKLRSMQKDVFLNELKNYKHKTYKQLESGKLKPVYTDASEIWLASYLRSEVDDVIIDPIDRPGCLNLWSGIPSIPAAAKGPLKEDLEFFLKFVHEDLCNGILIAGNTLLDWAAHVMQKPDEKSTIVPCLIGKQGAGKGLFTYTLKQILGHTYLEISKADDLTGKFNIKQMGKLLTVLDESTYKGNHVASNLLKNLTGNLWATYEEKFGAIIECKNLSRYIIQANSKKAINVEQSNRRYFMIDTGSHHIKDSEKFKRLWALANNPNFIAAFHQYLLDRDLTEFNPFVLPVTHAGEITKIEGEGVISQYIYDRMIEDPRELFIEGEYLCKKMIFDDFSRFQRQINSYEKGISRKQFWDKVCSLVGIDEKKNSKRIFMGKNERPYMLTIDPEEFVRRYCLNLQIAFPSDFDELELMLTKKRYVDEFAVDF